MLLVLWPPIQGHFQCINLYFAGGIRREIKRFLGLEGKLGELVITQSLRKYSASMSRHFLFLSSGIFPPFVKQGHLKEWVLDPELERERKVGPCLKEKVCLRSEWEGGRGTGKACGNERKGLMEVREDSKVWWKQRGRVGKEKPEGQRQDKSKEEVSQRGTERKRPSRTESPGKPESVERVETSGEGAPLSAPSTELEPGQQKQGKGARGSARQGWCSGWACVGA